MRFRVELKNFDRALPGGKGIYGVLQNETDENGNIVVEGIVNFIIEAGPTSPIRGTALFNEMMGDFGDNARVIEGIWIQHEDGSDSTNIDKVNELTTQGMLLEDAVHHAWTMTRAKKRGFSKVHIVRTEGVPGNYNRVEVLIEK